MSVGEKMKALADEVRRVSHKPDEEKLSLDGMTTALKGVNVDFLKSIIERTVTEITADDLAGAIWLGSSAFRQCEKLRKVTLPDTVDSLGDNCFCECKALEEIDLNKITNVEANAFSACVSLMEVVIPEGVIWVGSHAFEKCTNLKKVTWAINTYGLYNGCFSNCTSLESVDFSKCKEVEAMHNNNVFYNVPSTCKFYVPAHLLDEWKSATNWSNFADQITVAELSGTWEFNDVIAYWKPIYGFAKFTLPLGEDSTKEYDHITWRNLGGEDYTLSYISGNWGSVAYSEDLGWHDTYLKGGKRIDFGEEPQQVSVDLCEFIKANATKL